MNKVSIYKNEVNLNNRKIESNRIIKKYPDRYPVIVEKSEFCKKNITIAKKKYLVPKNLSIGEFMYVIRKKMIIH